MKLKKRIVGFLLLIGLVLIIIPLFFGRSIPSDELKLSGHIPKPPPKANDIAMPVPPQSATVPAIAQASKPTTETTDSSIVFEQLQSSATNAVNKANMLPLSTPSTSLPVSGSTHSTSDISTTHKAVVPTQPSSVTATQTPTPKLTASIQPVASVSPTPIETSTKSMTVQATAKNSVVKATKPTQKAIAKSLQLASQLPLGAEAWSVQLGSFSAKSNAEKLMQRLQSQGFTAYLRTTNTAKVDFVRVLVGPYLHHSDAVQLQARIQKELNIQGILVKIGGT